MSVEETRLSPAELAEYEFDHSAFAGSLFGRWSGIFPGNSLVAQTAIAISVGEPPATYVGPPVRFGILRTLAAPEDPGGFSDDERAACALLEVAASVDVVGGSALSTSVGGVLVHGWTWGTEDATTSGGAGLPVVEKRFESDEYYLHAAFGLGGELWISVDQGQPAYVLAGSKD